MGGCPEVRLCKCRPHMLQLTGATQICQHPPNYQLVEQVPIAVYRTLLDKHNPVKSKK